MERQLLNGVMMSALIRTLKLSIGGDDPLLHRDLWQKSWRVRQRHRQPAIQNDEDEEPPRRGRQVLGLDYGRCVARFGLVWLPEHMILWNHTLPTFQEHFIRKLAISRNGFEKSLKHTTTIAMSRAVAKDDQFLTLFDEYLADAKTSDSDDKIGVLKLAAELVIQNYISQVLELLTRRAFPGDSAADQEHRDHLKDRLTDNEVKGLSGLTYVMIERLIGAPPDIARVKSSARNGRSVLAKYYTGSWPDKVNGIFALNDLTHDDDGPRAWDRTSFRKLTEHLRARIVSAFDAETGIMFDKILSKTAARRLLIIPLYDKDHLATSAKASINNRSDTQAAIRDTKWLQRTKFAMPCLGASAICSKLTVDSIIDNNLPQKPSMQADCKQIAIGLRAPDLRILSENHALNPMNGTPQDPGRYQFSTHLSLAEGFFENLQNEEIDPSDDEPSEESDEDSEVEEIEE
ncbi:MAG: hypothetical protein M1827_006225 [Pycnora praestabilis]|nr:MAG: hypothetical protein M1827_006225 [Pycnora praestabilis]